MSETERFERGHTIGACHVGNILRNFHLWRIEAVHCQQYRACELHRRASIWTLVGDHARSVVLVVDGVDGVVQTSVFKNIDGLVDEFLRYIGHLGLVAVVGEDV